MDFTWAKGRAKEFFQLSSSPHKKGGVFTSFLAEMVFEGPREWQSLALRALWARGWQNQAFLTILCSFASSKISSAFWDTS